MVKHLVMWTLKEKNNDTALEIKNSLEGLHKIYRGWSKF